MNFKYSKSPFSTLQESKFEIGFLTCLSETRAFHLSLCRAFSQPQAIEREMVVVVD
jgi:hypothetical protein